MVSESEFSEVLVDIGNYIKIGPRRNAGSSEAEATNIDSILEGENKSSGLSADEIYD